MLDSLPPDALKLVLAACLNEGPPALASPAGAAAAPSGGGDGGSAQATQAALALRTLAALRCTNRALRQTAAQVPASLAVEPRPELAEWLGGGLTVRGLHFVSPVGRQQQQYKPWMPGHSLTAWLSSLQISSGLAMRRALQDNVDALAATLRELTGVPLSSDLPIAQLTSLRHLGLVNPGDEEILRLKPLAALPQLENLSAQGYYQYDLLGLPPSVRRLRLQWQGGGGRVRIPPWVSLERLHLEGMDLLLPFAALERCQELLAEVFALFLALPASPAHQAAGQLSPPEVAQRLVASLHAPGCACRRLEVVANLLRVMQPLSEDYDFRSRTPVAGRCVEDGGSEARRPDLQLTAALRPQEGVVVDSREERGAHMAGYRRTIIQRVD